MARNLRRTYLRPFVIVTANMSKAMSQRGGGRCSSGRAQVCPGRTAPERPSRGGGGSTAPASVPLSVEWGDRTLLVQPAQTQSTESHVTPGPRASGTGVSRGGEEASCRDCGDPQALHNSGLALCTHSERHRPKEGDGTEWPGTGAVGDRATSRTNATLESGFKGPGSFMGSKPHR